MIDETETPATAAGSTDSAGDAAAFCQQCGRTLSAATRRQVGSGTFCEPCAAIRQEQGAGWTSVNFGAAGAPSGPAAASEPNPAVAGFLGLIPGVGAMYNGQYAKGALHLIVFVVLVSLADNLNWVFWWFVWGWIFYQAFEAYHTALARRDGLPLPDAFGWNDLGERLGFAKSSAARPVRAPQPGNPTPFTTVATPASEAQPIAVPPYFAESATASTPPLPPPPPGGGAAAYGTYGQVPYSTTYTGAAATSSDAAGYVAGQPAAGLARQRFPLGAVWLIGLGVLFLLGNILPSWRISGRWLVPVLLAAVAFWTGGRRLTSWQEMNALRGDRGGTQAGLVSALLGPCILLTLAALLAVQDAGWIPLRHSWPALLIVWGALLLLQRTQNYLPPDASSAHVSPPMSGVVPPPSDSSPR